MLRYEKVSDVNIIFEHSPWFLLPAILLGISYALLLYYRNKKQVFSKTLQWILGILRFVLVSSIAILLLHPNLRFQKKIIEAPVIVVAHDNSASMVLGPDSATNAQVLPERFDSLVQLLSRDFQVDSYLFDGEPQASSKLDFTGQQTDISRLFKKLHTAYYNRNLATIVLVTDGISNHGIPVDLMEEAHKIPVYAIGTGDTIVRPDLSIADLRNNKIIFKETRFPVEVTVKALKAAGKTVNVELYMDGEKKAESMITISSDQFSQSVAFQIDATESGRKKLVAHVSGISDELNLENNKRETYIDILNEQSEILILARAPHPDVSAIRSVFDDQYKVDLEYLQNWKPKDKNYSLAILHEVPAIGSNNTQIENFLESNPELPLWIIIGQNSNLSSLNKVQNSVQFSSAGTSILDILPVSEPNFTLFSMDDFRLERINKFPALVSPLMEFSLSMNHSTFIYQRIKGVPTNYPLMGFNEDNNRRMAYLSGTGLWRWRIADYSMNKNHETFNEIVNKTINYLLIKTDKRRLRLFADASYRVNEEIRFRAELYNPALEMVNEPDVSLQLIQLETETTYDYLFSRTENAYQLNIGRLPSGVYSFSTEAILGTEKLTYEGEFVVVSTSLEAQNLVADHSMLRRLAGQSGGVFFKTEETLKAVQAIKEDKRITHIASHTQNYTPLIGLVWLPVLLLLLISLEWFLRKIHGNY